MDVYAAINTRRTVREFEDRAIASDIIEKIIDAGLKAPTNDHMRSWEFVLVQDKSVRANMLRTIPNAIPTSENDVNRWLDTWESTDQQQRDMYLNAMPRQFSMLYNAACLILPFFHQEGPLLQPKTLSSLNGFASIWCCIENILLAASAEGIFGVTRIPVGDEAEHIRRIINYPDDYVMPCYIGLGYPAKNAEKVIQNKVNASDKIHFDKW